MRASLPFVLLAALGCASGSTSPSSGAADSGWRLQGTRLIGCCCASPCSCRINKPPTQAHGCEYTTAVHVEKGHLGKTRMDGATWALCGLGFAEDKSTNWVVVYVDQKMSDEQVKALQDWMAAGMKEINEKKLPYLAGAFAGFKKAPMTWLSNPAKEEYGCSIPGILEFRVTWMHNPGHAEPVRSSGIFDDYGNSFTHCDTASHVYKDAAPELAKYSGWDLTGRQSNHADFVIGSDVKSACAIGWGCWSAHSDLGGKDKYQERLIGHPKK